MLGGNAFIDGGHKMRFTIAAEKESSETLAGGRCSFEVLPAVKLTTSHTRAQKMDRVFKRQKNSEKSVEGCFWSHFLCVAEPGRKIAHGGPLSSGPIPFVMPLRPCLRRGLVLRPRPPPARALLFFFFVRVWSLHFGVSTTQVPD